jgi:transglutaminase-like putative cysteine protease
MSLGQFALGLASIAIGVHQIHNGFKRIQPPGARRPGLGAPGELRSVQSGKTAVGPIRLRTYRIKNLEDRIAHLRELIEQGKRDPVVYEFARRAVNRKCGNSWCVPEKDNGKELKALFKAIRQNVRYTSDIDRVDSYQKPRHTLALRTADCDDYSTLICAAAATLGLKCRLKVIKTQGASDWNHIYAQVGLPRHKPSRWVSLDASVNMPMGWEAPKQAVVASRIFPT